MTIQPGSMDFTTKKSILDYPHFAWFASLEEAQRFLDYLYQTAYFKASTDKSTRH